MDKSIAPINQIAIRSSTCCEFSNSNPAEVVEIEDDDISVGTVEKQMEDLKLNHRFNEENVPEIFKVVMNRKMIRFINILMYDKHCTMKFDEIEILLVESNNYWKIYYKNVHKAIESGDPEKSIIDHLWFVLKNANIKLHSLSIDVWEDPESQLNQYFGKLDLEKLNTLLQSMFNTFDHQIHTSWVNFYRLNEDTCLSVLKHVKPGVLGEFCFEISWKEEGNHQKMKEIVGTEQWKQVKRISSFGKTTLQVDDSCEFKTFHLQLDRITPEDVLRVTEHVFNSTGPKSCTLASENEDFDINATIDFLRLQIDGSQITETSFVCSFRFKIVKSAKFVVLKGGKNYINIHNHSEF